MGAHDSREEPRRGILRPAYLAQNWGQFLVGACQRQPLLNSFMTGRRGSPLSDFAFAIDTRLGYLPALTEALDRTVMNAVRSTPKLAYELLRTGEGFEIDRRILDGALIAAATFVSESRALFENLASFYGTFLEQALRQPARDPKAQLQGDC